MYEDSDDVYAFIAGYIGGGVPYGITWEELGLNHMRLMKNSWNHMTGWTGGEKMRCLRKMRSFGVRMICTESRNLK